VKINRTGGGGLRSSQYRTKDDRPCKIGFNSLAENEIVLLKATRTDVTSRRDNDSTGCFKKSFTTLKAYINLYRGHVQCLTAIM
jgi:hypothetical protein